MNQILKVFLGCTSVLKGGGSGGVEEEKRGLKGKGRAENREKRWRGVRKNEGNGKGRGNRSAM